MEGPKRSLACNHCRLRKIKCSRTEPCAGCAHRGEECIYAVSKRGRRLQRNAYPIVSMPAYRVISMSDNNEREPQIESHLAHERQDVSSFDSARIAVRTPESSSNRRCGTLGAAPSRTLDGPAALLEQERGFPETPQFCLTRVTHNTTTSAVEAHSAASNDTEQGAKDADSFRKEDLTPPAHIFHWEHQGPASCLSICSAPAASWVQQRTGNSDFTNVARELVIGWTRRCKVPSRSLLLGQQKEPEADLAWRYCIAYFDESFESVYGFVDRSEFFLYLNAHFRKDKSVANDPAWHALRNTVYASGCRIVSSKDESLRYSDIQKEAWSYFQNAMSVHTELLFTFTSLMAVRALIAMTFFTEGLGSPALQYMLCSNAARLAQSKGLHRQPAPSWQIDEDQINNQNWLFWAVYYSEKSLALRTSRPSAIYDEEVSCQIPTQASPGSTTDVSLFRFVVEHAQIASQISRRLASFGSLHQPKKDLWPVAGELQRQLDTWKESLPIDVRPRSLVQISRLSSSPLSSNSRSLAILSLQLGYYASVLALYTPFMNPWISKALGVNDLTTEQQYEEATNAVADAARNLITLSTQVEVTAASPQWSAFTYPLIGVTNLFIHILKAPDRTSARADLALLDVAAGHYGRVELITESDMSFSFARKLAEIARKAVEKTSLSAEGEGNGNGGSHDVSEEREGENLDSTLHWPQTEDWGNMDFTLEDWSFLQPMLVEDFLNL